MALLLTVVAAFSWVAYREVRHTALAAAGERLRDVAEQLGDLLEQSVTQRVAETRAAADATAGGPVTSNAPVAAGARDAIERLRASSAQVHRVALWDTAGTLVFEAAPPAEDTLEIHPRFPSWAAADTASVSGFLSNDKATWFEVAVPVRASGRAVGFVVQTRRLASSSQGAQALADLIGKDALFLVGVPGGAWSDLVGIVDGPPARAAVDASPAEYHVADRGWRIAAGTRIAGTPWEVWVEFPRGGVLARSRAFLARMLPLGALVVLFGAVAAWLVSRRLTGSLGELTSAASAMAHGDYARRVAVRRRDELGELSGAFNMMAERVATAHQQLEHRVAERTAELQASRERFRAIALTAHEAIITADPAGLVTYVNPGAERIFGYRARDVVGQPITTLMPERYRDAERRGFRRVVETGQSEMAGRTVELVGLRSDGTEFPIELSLATWSYDGEPAFAAIIRDVTARRESDEALRRHAAELKAVNEELEAFSYSVSHDLRAPLRSIHGFSQVLLEDYRDRLDAEGARHLERVCAGVDRMGELIDDLLALARAARSTMTRSAVDLGALARGIAHGLRAAAPDRIAEFRIASDLTVTGDARLLRHALENLLGNAWKFTANVARAEIEIGTSKGGNGEREFFVRDNGAGFDMQYVEKLFRPFQRLHRASDYPGTGVGLALVQRIIHRHGGTIRAEGAPGAGATFHFTLPADDVTHGVQT